MQVCCAPGDALIGRQWLGGSAGPADAVCRVPCECMACNLKLWYMAGGASLQGQGARVDEPTLDRHLGMCRSSLQGLMVICQR